MVVVQYEQAASPFVFFEVDVEFTSAVQLILYPSLSRSTWIAGVNAQASGETGRSFFVVNAFPEGILKNIVLPSCSTKSFLSFG